MKRTSNNFASQKSLSEYLIELEQITGQRINSESLCSVEDLEKIRSSSLDSLQKKGIGKFSMPFGEKGSKKFRDFIVRLSEANSSPVYVWTNKANSHGLCKISSIASIDLSFPFDINSDGIIVFLTEDLNEKLLFDFSCDSDNQEILEIELQGTNWAFISP